MPKYILERAVGYADQERTQVVAVVDISIDTEGANGTGSIERTYVQGSASVFPNNWARQFAPGTVHPRSPFYSAQGLNFDATFENPTVFWRIIPTPTRRSTTCTISGLGVSVVHPAGKDANGNLNRNGSITVSINASSIQGIAEFSINDGVTWQGATNPDGGNNASFFSNLGPGTYKVIAATAGRFCKLTRTVTLADQTPPVNDLKINQVIPTNETALNAKDGTITVLAAGSNRPLLYNIYKMGSEAFLPFPTTTTKFTGLEPGLYGIVVTDSARFERRQENIEIKAFVAPEPPEEPIEPLIISEVKTVELRSGCRNPFFVRWLNLLGGWDCWLFEVQQEYSLELTEVGVFEKNYTDLATLQGVREKYTQKGKRSVVVGCDVETERALVIAEMLLSEKIYWYRNPANLNDRFELTPVESNIPYMNTRNPRQQLEFTFELPDYIL